MVRLDQIGPLEVAEPPRSEPPIVMSPMLPVVLVPFVRSDPQVAAVLDLVFLLPPLLLIGFAYDWGKGILRYD